MATEVIELSASCELVDIEEGKQAQKIRYQHKPQSGLGSLILLAHCTAEEMLENKPPDMNFEDWWPGAMKYQANLLLNSLKAVWSRQDKEQD